MSSSHTSKLLLSLITADRQFTQKIRDFWFEGFIHPHPLPQHLMKKWFGMGGDSSELDELISKEYGPIIQNVIDHHRSIPNDINSTNNNNNNNHNNNANNDCSFTAMLEQLDNKDILSLIILLDQFPRNSFRGKPQSFQADPVALSITKSLIELKRDTLFHPVERMFVYLPLEHSENLMDQQECVVKMKSILQDCEQEQVDESSSDNRHNEYIHYKPLALGFEKFAQSHLQIIEKFGRFPHRNTILGRESTREELDYLKNGGETFGTSSTTSTDKK